MNHAADRDIVEFRNTQAASPVVLVCEHASAHIPDEYDNLGLSGAMLHSHIAWDIGALGLASEMAGHLDGVLVASRISRLVYDCNRPPEAPSAMPAQSEVFEVPGNAGLSPAQRSARAKQYYVPFRAAVAETVAGRANPVLVTVHSFTPVYHGQRRAVEIGVLHDTDARLADALLSASDMMRPHVVRRNDPYGPEDGVTHTLREHGLPGGHLNVMLELRSDLIAEPEAQAAMALRLSAWVAHALDQLGVGTCWS